MQQLKYDITTAQRYVQIAIDRMTDFYSNEYSHEYSELATYEKMLQALQIDLAKTEHCNIMDVYLIYVRLSTIFDYIKVCTEHAPIDIKILDELHKALECLDKWVIGDKCITLNKET